MIAWVEFIMIVWVEFIMIVWVEFIMIVWVEFIMREVGGVYCERSGWRLFDIFLFVCVFVSGMLSEKVHPE